jgi:hypothetical protein
LKSNSLQYEESLKAQDAKAAEAALLARVAEEAKKRELEGRIKRLVVGDGVVGLLIGLESVEVGGELKTVRCS